MKTAVVLAGGKGTRLRPLTYTVPKPLIPVCNVPLLDMILKLIFRSGFKRVIVVVKYLGDQIRKHLEEVNDKLGIDLIVPNIDPLDTADAVRKCRNYIDGDFLVTMGDVLTNMDLDSFAKFHERRGGIASVALKAVENPLEYGVVLLGHDERIELFMEKPRSIELYVVGLAYSKVRPRMFYANLVNTGFYALSYEILDILDDNPYLMDWGRHVFPYLLENGYDVYGWNIGDAYWRDIGRLQSYLQANFDLMEGLVPPFKPPGFYSRGVWVAGDADIERATILPPVVIGDGVVAEEGAVIGPYAVLGNGVLVASNAQVIESVVWDDSFVGSGAKVEESVLARSVVVGEGARVLRHSAVGEGVQVPCRAELDGESVPPSRLAHTLKAVVKR